ncbi:hypothetical protein SODALDRAFT_333201 [Sodiomyces alkalinus F11]|uniref:50S ribosomal protein L24 n=1 Tax=Sodiomyces alkalinus (strain CBS 110278 / VKM F-3762 / F11) TaxID=1314773 RepID=A0A3N2PVR9_SODAK|nr:hypothetical protein SODALDRAFT_333201 [Sodiomyces alkalinus F11]ROT38595.1 hypothetical protein SODALDRAFT_333201 [Sodiomyces alkalinus F11]
MRHLTPQRGTAASLRTLTSTLTRLSVSSQHHQQTPQAPPPSLTSRPFSTTPAPQTKTINLRRIPKDPVPPYPYGDRLLYKQSNNGLYGTATIRHGNNISSDNKVKSPRTWRPNIHRKRLWSAALGAWVRAKLSMRVLRTIRREGGGIDAYVLKSKPARLRELGPGGWRLRWLVMQTAAVRARFDHDRARLGLPPLPGSPADNEDLVKVMLDYATPGPLSAASREILARRAAQVQAMEAAAREAAEVEFALGEEAEVPDEMLAEDLVDEVVLKDVEEQSKDKKP